MSDTAGSFDSGRLVTPSVMALADENAARAGISIERLIARVANAIADHVTHEIAGQRVAVIAGPGNNGADAIAAIPLLLARGAATVDGFVLGRRVAGCRDLDAFEPQAFDLVIDALFGGGLSRDLSGEAARVIVRLNASDCRVLSIDLPSGIDGATGAERGVSVRASETLTFVRRKPGHLLMPGRDRCGTVTVADIGLPEDALCAALGDAAPLWANAPALWGPALAVPRSTGHKFDRGHAIVLSGGASHTGAARMTATAALRSGAGLVTLLSPGSAMLVNAAHLTAVMLQRCDGPADLESILSDARLNAAALGPGFGIGARARDCALALLKAGRALLLDADALTSFKDEPDRLFAAITENRRCVLTPHGGEFARLFPDIAAAEGVAKHERARRAADRSGAVVVLKGADTVIAAPDGRAAINETGTPWLATAGSGDVLGGIILGQLAAGMPIFEAACAGVWMHGRAAELHGPGLIAEDLPGLIPAVLRELV